MPSLPAILGPATILGYPASAGEHPLEEDAGQCEADRAPAKAQARGWARFPSACGVMLTVDLGAAART